MRSVLTVAADASVSEAYRVPSEGERPNLNQCKLMVDPR